MVPQLKFFETPEIVRNDLELGSSYLDKTPTVADMTLLGRWYNGPSKNPQSAHQCTVYGILCEVKFKFKSLQLNFMPNGTASGLVDNYG